MTRRFSLRKRFHECFPGIQTKPRKTAFLGHRVNSKFLSDGIYVGIVLTVNARSPVVLYLPLQVVFGGSNGEPSEFAHGSE
jgi:hypothetical protein